MSSEAYARVELKSMYGISSIALVVIGIQLFMCTYGLIIFMESPQSRRQGRRRYIIISFLILVLTVLSEVGDEYQEFQLLANPGGTLQAMSLRGSDDHTWWAVGSTSCSTVVNWIGEGLLLIKTRRIMAKLFPFYENNRLIGVVAILVESALPVSLAGIAFSTVIYSSSIPGLINRAVFLVLWFAFNALSPQMIIFQVTIGRSWSHEGPDSDLDFALRFAEDTPHRFSIPHSPFPVFKERPCESNPDNRLSLTTLRRSSTPSAHNN
ncbi:hypothetical protein CPB83DRAFT_897817 [Crepidotus variabilis]|uniref:Uncharacterized protein n=1 Tax=Crepidotus variabilis TaxID=179855 RepID=A0A9P6E8P4_9AGAR|nr:hypothetical protein CPB83DRAFT_897817 [Crepidotus variabilis]